MNNNFDITWHNTKDEMSGTDYDLNKSFFNIFLVRYTFEDDDTECSYELARLANGKFILDFYSWDKEERQEAKEEARVLQWAFIDHPNDYD